MGKKELVDGVAVACGLTKVAARKAADALFGTPTEPGVICEALQVEGDVVLSGFGTIEVAVAGARKVRNVRTGEEMTRPAGTRIRFSAGKTLKERLQDL